jgi:hypothetical protein
VKKKVFSICLSVVVLVALIAVLVQGCGNGNGGEQGTIEVKATLCGNPWPPQGTGAVNYKLTPASGSPVNGTKVPDSFTVDVGDWTCEYVSGGPADSCLENITPAGVTVAAGETKTITIELEYCEDAWIEFDTWTVDKIPWQESMLEAWPCQIIDVHFTQGVDGCEEYVAAVNETSRLWIHYMGYSELYGGEPMPPMPGQEVSLYVVNDDCAVNKTAAPPEKVSQKTTHFGTYIDPGKYIDLPWCEDTELDVETIWMLEKEIDYTKSINWFGIWVGEYVPDLHPCVLFELIVPLGPPGWYVFSLVAEAEVTLMDDEDANIGNNKDVSPPLTLWVWVGP